MPLLAQLPLPSPRCARAVTTGRPITAVDPDSESAQAFFVLADQVAVDLKPRKVFNRELKVI